MSQRQVQINTELARSALASDVLAIVRRSVAEFNVVNCGTALSRIARAPDGRRLVAREGGDPDVASLLATAAGLVRHHARHVESRQLASLLHACGKLGVGVEAAAELVSAVERATEMHASKFNPQELANAVWGCAKLGVRVDRALVRLLGDAAAASLRRGGAGSGSGSRDEKKKFDWRVDWTAQGVSNVAWAFATLGASAREPGAFAQLFHALFSAIERKASAGAFNAQETANALWAVARLAASADDAVHQSIGPDNSDSDSEGSALRSARAAASALASSTTGSWFERQRKEGGLESQHVANIAWACGKLGLASDARVAEANATAAAAAGARRQRAGALHDGLGHRGVPPRDVYYRRLGILGIHDIEGEREGRRERKRKLFRERLSASRRGVLRQTRRGRSRFAAAIGDDGARLRQARRAGHGLDGDGRRRRGVPGSASAAGKPSAAPGRREPALGVREAPTRGEGHARPRVRGARQGGARLSPRGAEKKRALAVFRRRNANERRKRLKRLKRSFRESFVHVAAAHDGGVVARRARKSGR
jgi:hypothetical protein